MTENQSSKVTAPSNAPDKLTRLIRRFAANLAAFRPDLAGRFACPLCWRLFAETDTALLSIEHAVPYSVGGRIEVVTCKSCNNTMGSLIDAQLKRQIEMQAYFDGKLSSPVRNRVFASGLSATADVTIQNDGDTLIVDVALLRELSNPQHFDSVLATAAQTPAPLGFDLDSRAKPDVRKARLALLKSAYLLMFHYFGYAYVAADPAKIVHQQLTHAQDDIIPLSVAVCPIPDTHTIAGVAVITQPVHLSCFLIPIVATASGVTFHFGVVLPGYLAPDETYPRWNVEASNSASADVKMRCFQPPPEIVLTPTTDTLPVTIWNDAIEAASV